MSDKFGRIKSTRWVKASVPSYGDEWGDDYDYDYGTDSESEHSETRITDTPGEKEQVETNTDGQDHISQLENTILNEKELEVPQKPNLILSIDKLRTRQYNSDVSSSEDEGVPEIMDEMDRKEDDDENEDFGLNLPKNAHQPDSREIMHEQLLDKPVNQTITTGNKGKNSKFLPPTPTFNTNNQTLPETPLSDRSYQSDADSIQHEPSDLNVREAHTSENQSDLKSLHKIEPKPLNNEEDSNREEGQIQTQEETELQSGIDENRETSVAEVATPLVLSIDNKKFDQEYAESDDDDDWGYNSQKDSDDEITEDKKTNRDSRDINKHRSNDQRYQDFHGNDNGEAEIPSNRKSSKEDDLDNLLYDLQYVSHSENKNDRDIKENQETDGNTSYSDNILPNMDSLQNISLPDFENKSFSQYDEEGEKGLNLRNVLNDEAYTSQPPTPIEPLSIAENESGHESFISGLTGHRRSIRKPPPNTTQKSTNRNELMSVDYSNIADAVSGYMNNDASTKNLDAITENEHPKMSDTKDLESKSVDGELKRTESSGSLSTGNFSFDTNSNSHKDSNQRAAEGCSDKDDMSRRDSTLSTNTFSMGSWKPNTNNYRDQFINDNDNESHINFNPYATETTNNYNKFTKMRTVSGASYDTVSNASSESVPETIDAALPSINEDPDNNDTTVNDSDNSLQLVKTSNTTDSVLKEHHHHPQVFKEERVTPLSSKDNLVKGDAPESQKYSSLLGRSKDMSDSSSSLTRKSSNSSSIQGTELSDKRIVSGSSVGSGNTTLKGTRNFTPQPYNLYNWKSIMATSQPIDRIRLLKEALDKETEYDTGLQNWLNESLRLSENSSNIHIGKIASEAYQNAAHNDIRRHASIRSKVSIVRDKVETSGLQASSLGKRFFNRGKKLIKSSGTNE